MKLQTQCSFNRAKRTQKLEMMRFQRRWDYVVSLKTSEKGLYELSSSKLTKLE